MNETNQSEESKRATKTYRNGKIPKVGDAFVGDLSGIPVCGVVVSIDHESENYNLVYAPSLFSLPSFDARNCLLLEDAMNVNPETKQQP